MKTLTTEKMMCPCCMEEHDVQRVAVVESTVFKGVSVNYDAQYFYCERADKTYADEQQISSNDISLKNAYREMTGLLTSHQIAAIRIKYGISQRDLCLLLGWGGKTITRYESHQVQDIAHDTILRKLDSDPEWFLQLLQAGKESLSAVSYTKYAEAGAFLFGQYHDMYLKSAIRSKYARFLHIPEASGGKTLSPDVVVDMIRYYANANGVANLFRVKLMKMLWYADALSYKRRGHAISGLVYIALPMGAVPIAYESIFNLSTVNCEEIDMGDGTGYKFLPTENKEYPHLSIEDMEILDAVIRQFGSVSKNEIVEKMRLEDAYTKTVPYDIIQFRYVYSLRLS